MLDYRLGRWTLPGRPPKPQPAAVDLLSSEDSCWCQIPLLRTFDDVLLLTTFPTCFPTR